MGFSNLGAIVNQVEHLILPAFILLDPEGKEVFRYVGKNNRDRYSFEQLESKITEFTNWYPIPVYPYLKQCKSHKCFKQITHNKLPENVLILISNF